MKKGEEDSLFRNALFISILRYVTLRSRLGSMNQRVLARSKGGVTTCLVVRIDANGMAAICNDRRESRMRFAPTVLMIDEMRYRSGTINSGPMFGRDSRS